MRIITATLLSAIGTKAFVLPSTTMCRPDHPSTSLNMGLIDNILVTKTLINKDSTLQVLDEIGRGTYGVVHLTKLQQKDDDAASSIMSCVAKRAWTLDELREKNSDNNNNNGEAKISSDQDLKELSKRCNYYLDVERHCLQKLNDVDSNSPYVPKLLGEYPNEKGRGDWLVFELVEGIINDDKPAKTLADILELDWIDQHNKQQNHHHISTIRTSCMYPLVSAPSVRYNIDEDELMALKTRLRPTISIYIKMFQQSRFVKCFVVDVHKGLDEVEQQGR